MTVALNCQYLRLTNTKEASCRQTQIHTHTYISMISVSIYYFL